MKSVLIALICCLSPSPTSAAETDPVQVFILVGQSNMEGKGAIRHLDALVEDEATRAQFEHLKRGAEFVERDDVFITFDHSDRDHRHGPLTVGYGSKKDQIGPELGFGRVVGDALEPEVLLIKCAWGGASLKKDFLPPSAGGPGPNYLRMLEEVREALSRIGYYIPGPGRPEHELAGLVWFQGWNDAVGSGNPDYTEQLASFIRDVRKDLEAPRLPVVIGELGQAGTDANAKVAGFRAQQAAVAELPEFAGTVAFVETHGFIDMRMHELFELWRQCKSAAKKADGEQAEEAAWKPWRAVEDEWSASTSDRPYHYFGSGKTFYLIGEAFGRAMVELGSEQR